MKKKRTNASQYKQIVNDVSDNEEYQDAVDPSASSFMYDAVDEYYENQEREGAEKLAKLMKKPKIFVQDEVLGVASSSEDDELYNFKPKKKGKAKFEDPEILPPLNSDLENDKEDNDEEKISKQWGKKRSAYYDADYVDEEWNDANEADAEVAELEEQEALAIQQRLAQQLEEADFGLDFITHLKEAEQLKEVKPVEEKIDIDLSQLSKKDKLKLLNEESPELVELIEDFKVQMKDLKGTIAPIMKLIDGGIIPPSWGASFVRSKYHLIVNYCMQISYYFVLKTKRVSIHNHPVIKRMVQFRALLHQLDSSGTNVRSEIQNLLAMICQKKEIRPSDFRIPLPKKNLRILARQLSAKEENAEKKPLAKTTEVNDSKINSKVSKLTSDEQAAVDFYKAVRADRKKKKIESDSESVNHQEDSRDQVVDMEHGESTEEHGKRAINYQIAKNKGLTPHRSKEQRNPRVKNRMKFRKAKIRRRGAVREVRKELTKYGGEISGIKATVIRSVKLK